jgi:hypothetical protein
MEQQLYGSSNRIRDTDQRVISGKQLRAMLPGNGTAVLPPNTAGPRSPGATIRAHRRSDGRRSDGAGGSADGSGSASGGGGSPGRRATGGLRGLFFNILRSRYDSSDGSASSLNGTFASGGSGTPRSIEAQLVRREGSMHLPRPADCNMPSVHSGGWGRAGARGRGVLFLSGAFLSGRAADKFVPGQGGTTLRRAQSAPP